MNSKSRRTSLPSRLNPSEVLERLASRQELHGRFCLESRHGSTSQLEGFVAVLVVLVHNKFYFYFLRYIVNFHDQRCMRTIDLVKGTRTCHTLGWPTLTSMFQFYNRIGILSNLSADCPEKGDPRFYHCRRKNTNSDEEWKRRFKG